MRYENFLILPQTNVLEQPRPPIRQNTATKMSHVNETGSVSSGSVNRKRSRVAENSCIARQRRKHEFVRLRQENDRLRQEQFIFQQAISKLEQEVEHDLGAATLQDLEENESLKQELKEHRDFVDNVLRHLVQVPSEKNARAKLYEEGIECAQTFVANLLVQCSKEKWAELGIPPPAENQGIHPSVGKVHLFRKFTNQIFGKPEIDPNGSPVDRSNLCGFLDFQGKEFTIDAVTEVLVNLLISKEEQCKIFGLSSEDVKLTRISDDTPDGTKVVHYSRKDRGSDCVLLVNKSRQSMLRSWLKPPIVGCDTNDQEKLHGVVDVSMVSCMSTTLAECSHRNQLPASSHGVKRLESLFLLGFLCFQEKQYKKGSKVPTIVTRLVYIQSVPITFSLGKSSASEREMLYSNNPQYQAKVDISNYVTTVLNEFAAQVHEKESTKT